MEGMVPGMEMVFYGDNLLKDFTWRTATLQSA